MPLISIIMPVYNAEEYLASSIESVLTQSARDFELLLVNDGSKDSSLAICRDYEQRDCRVRVLDKPNGGVSSARNMGLDEAQGEWVMFVDADDWLIEGTIEKALPYLSDYDVVRCSYKELHENNVIIDRPMREFTSAEELFRAQLERRTALAVWGALFRRSLFEEYNIRFSPHLTYGEDWLVSMLLTLSSMRVKTLVDNYCYLYNRANMGSCTRLLTIDKMLQQFEIMRLLRQRVGDGRYRKSMRYTHCCMVCEMLKYFPQEELCQAIIEVRDRIDFVGWWDVLWVDVSLRKKLRMWKFLRYCRAHGMKH